MDAAVVQMIYVLMLLLVMLCEMILTDTRFPTCIMTVGLGEKTILVSFSDRQDFLETKILPFPVISFSYSSFK